MLCHVNLSRWFFLCFCISWCRTIALFINQRRALLLSYIFIHYNILFGTFLAFGIGLLHMFVCCVSCVACSKQSESCSGHSLLVFIPFASCWAAHCDAQCVVELFSQCALHMCIIQQHMSECTHFPRCAIVIFTTSVNEHNVNMWSHFMSDLGWHGPCLFISYWDNRHEPTNYKASWKYEVSVVFFRLLAPILWDCAVLAAWQLWTYIWWLNATF